MAERNPEGDQKRLLDAPRAAERVYLVGFMAAGKTTVGRLAALRLGFSFVDTDRLVERAARLSVMEVFEREGEPAFRAREREALRLVSKRRRVVVATGGGAPLDESNRALMKRSGRVFWLACPFDIIEKRLGTTARRLRPLAAEAGRLAGLFAEREALYAFADCRLDATQPPDVLANTVAELAMSREHEGA